MTKPFSLFGGLKWYEYLPNRDRLELWTRSLAPGRITSLRWDLKHDTAWFDPKHRSIGINPISVGKTPREQWIGCRAMAAHEAGHANYTGNSLGEGATLHQLSNILEDQRIEFLMCQAFPALTREIRAKNRWRWNTENDPIPMNDNPEHILAAALYHRWEWWLGIKPSKRKRKREAASKSPLSKIILSEENQKRWVTVRPWVEESWVASSSDEVVAIAKRILEFLKIPETPVLSDWLKKLLSAEGMSIGTAAPLAGKPAAPKIGGAGEGDDESEEDGPHGHAATPDAKLDSGYSHINPHYAEYVDAVMPWVRQLAVRLERSTPRVRVVPNEAHGRYSLRADLRDAERPFLRRDAPGIAPGLAIDFLGDQSGSMGMATTPTDGEPKMNAARLGMMLMHLACEARKIAHAITLFDYHFSVIEYGGDGDIASALIAGWNGWTGEENLGKHMRERVPKLLARPEACKVLVVVHDGYPVADGDPEDVVKFQREYAGCIHVIGVYLHDEKVDADEEAQMRGLFQNLISASPKELPNKLGDLIAALA
jgi:hypothetical protein